MKVRDLPSADQDELQKRLPENEDWNVIAGLELNELRLYLKARREDAEATVARRRRRLDVELEIDALVEPLVAAVGDLPLSRLAWFLHGAPRARYEELMRELKEMSRPVRVTRGRQPWHQAVEDAIPDGPLLVQSEEDDPDAAAKLTRRNLDRIVARLLQRNAGWPADQVRRYAQYRLEIVTGIPLNDRGRNAPPNQGFAPSGAGDEEE